MSIRLEIQPPDVRFVKDQRNCESHVLFLGEQNAGEIAMEGCSTHEHRPSKSCLPFPIGLDRGEFATEFLLGLEKLVNARDKRRNRQHGSHIAVNAFRQQPADRSV